MEALYTPPVFAPQPSPFVYTESPLPSPITTPVPSVQPTPEPFDDNLELFGNNTWVDPSFDFSLGFNTDVFDLDAAVCEALRQTGHLPEAQTTPLDMPTGFSDDFWSEYTTSF